MYSGEFDGAAAFSGGGFMPSQTTPAPDPSFLFSKNRNVRTLLPMTVKQISEISSNDELSATINGVDVNTITIVGLLCSIQDKEPQFVFLIDDGTGQIECSRWAHEQMEFNEVNQISPVVDFNEITSHFIECIFVQFYNTRLRGGSSIRPQMTSSNNAIASNQYSIDEGKSIDQLVLNFLRRPEFLANNNGVHCNVIAQQLNLPTDKLMEALESLNENSLVYTIDDCHYKSAVNA